MEVGKMKIKRRCGHRLHLLWTWLIRMKWVPQMWGSIVCREKQSPKMALSKRCATRSDRRCNSLDVLLLSMVRHWTRQANGKSITAGARNKSNPSAEASHQGENAEDMLMTHVNNWGWVARHAPCDLIVPGRGVAQEVKVTSGDGPPRLFLNQPITHLNNSIYRNESSCRTTNLSFYSFLISHATIS